jgi:hypothetical protein
MFITSKITKEYFSDFGEVFQCHPRLAIRKSINLEGR